MAFCRSIGHAELSITRTSVAPHLIPDQTRFENTYKVSRCQERIPSPLSVYYQLQSTPLEGADLARGLGPCPIVLLGLSTRLCTMLARRAMSQDFSS